MSTDSGVTYKRLSDGSIEKFYSKDPDTLALKVQDAERSITARRKEDAAIAYRASPEFQPSESDFVKEESDGVLEYGEAVMRTGGRAGRGVLSGLVAIPTEIASTIGRGLQAAGIIARS